MINEYNGRVIISMEFDDDQNLIIKLDNNEIIEIRGEPTSEGNHGVYIHK